jgi:hypothetical protein
MFISYQRAGLSWHGPASVHIRVMQNSSSCPSSSTRDGDVFGDPPGDGIGAKDRGDHGDRFPGADVSENHGDVVAGVDFQRIGQPILTSFSRGLKGPFR